jgi:starch synthase
VVHANDWPTALVPTYLRALAAETPSLAAVRTVLTVHNAMHQGVFPRQVMPALGLTDTADDQALEHHGSVSFLKAGVLTAGAVTTVSPTYAREIQTPEGGGGLDGALRSRRDALMGVVNGVDYAVWNPATDAAIVARYDAEDFTNKVRSKGHLQNELSLPIDSGAPLVAFIGRMVEQKGIDLVAEALPRILRASEAQIVLAGDGDDQRVRTVEAAVARSHGRAALARAAGEALVHRIFAAADIVLVPSRFEPCGLVQMYAQRYGAVPVAHATGGLCDTIVDCDAKLETGTGFLFESATVDALVGATERAIAARNEPRWPALVRRVMRLDRSWDRPARRYEQVYRSLAAR